MATATEPHAAASEKYVDFDEFIDYQIAKTRSGIKATDLLTALIGGAAAVLTYVLVFALFDHWVIEGGFSHGTRVGLLTLLVAGLVGWIVWKLVLPYFRRVTALYAAKQIEQTQPDLQNSLLTLIDLKNSGRPVSQPIESALEKRSAVNLSHMDIEEAVDRGLLMRLTYVLFALVVLLCAYVIFSPKKLSNSLWRALLPTSDVAVATRTRIDDVSPGDIEVLARSQLEVTADLSGERPESVTLLYTTADRRFVDEAVTMRASEDGLRRYSGIITGENGRGILQNLTYRVVAGDAHSPAFAVAVKQPPSATVDEVSYEFPDYMGISPRTRTGGSVDSWEGTWVTVRARANMPITSALVLFSDTEDTSQKAEEIPATIEHGTQITARWRLRIRSDGTYPGYYRIRCRNAAKETDPDPALYSIKIRPDQPPQIQLVQPTGDLERPASAVVPLLFAAEDPDFLLRSVILHFELNGDAVPQQPRLYQAPPFRKSLHDVHQLELAPLGLNPGDRLTYWLEARDNMEPFADRSGNRANTPKLNITITEPASPEQVQQQLEEDQQQIADKLEEAQQPQNEDPAQPGADDSPREETSLPPPNAEERSQPGEEPAPDQPSEPPPQQTDESDTSDQSQSGSRTGDSTSGGQQQSSSGEAGEESAPGATQQPGEESGTSQEPTGDQSFDDLLKKLMQREQEQQQQDTQSSDGESPRQPSPTQEPSQLPEAPQSPDPGQSGPESASQGGQGGTGEDVGQQGPSQQSPQSSPGDSSAGSPAPANDASPNAQGNPADSTSATETSNQSPSDATERPGTGSEPTNDEGSTTPTADGPANDGTTDGGQKQPGTDSTGAKPGADGGTDPVAPKPVGPEGHKPPLSNEPGPKPGDPLPNPDAKQGRQPDGPDEPLQGEGNPEGQQSDRPQTGEGGNAQQTSQGNRGGDQQGAGDPTGRSGTQQPTGQESGQSGSDQPGDGSQQQRGGSESGSQGESASGGDSPSGSDASAGAEKPSPDGSPDGGGGGQQGKSSQEPVPKPVGESGSQSPEQGSQDNSDQQAVGGEDGGQREGGQQGGEPSGGESGEQGGAPGEGGDSSQSAKPGSNQGPGSPSPGGQSGGQGSRNAQESDLSRPTGAGSGGDAAPGELGDAGAGEGNDSNIQPEDPDLAAKKKSANLVLKRLQDQLQRGEIDPELEQDLGLTPERLREFTTRLEQRLAETASEDTSPEAEARRRQFEETLRTIDFDSKGTTRAGGDGPREAASGFAGRNRPAPPQHRDKERLYRQRLMKRARVN